MLRKTCTPNLSHMLWGLNRIWTNSNEIVLLMNGAGAGFADCFYRAHDVRAMIKMGIDAHES